jgi:hypothetical protein
MPRSGGPTADEAVCRRPIADRTIARWADFCRWSACRLLRQAVQAGQGARPSHDGRALYACSVLSRRFASLLLVCAAASACGEDAAGAGGPAPPRSPSSAPASQNSDGAMESAQAAATQTATEFLAALVAEDHDGAYALLSSSAPAGITLADFAAARQAKANSARSLGQRYELTAATSDPAGVTVTGNGRLADGTAAAISLPLAMDKSGWRVDVVPTRF